MLINGFSMTSAFGRARCLRLRAKRATFIKLPTDIASAAANAPTSEEGDRVKKIVELYDGDAICGSKERTIVRAGGRGYEKVLDVYEEILMKRTFLK